jgi:phage shock protein C
MTNKPLRRSNNRMVAGVCAGLAEYLGVDVTLVRLIAALTVVFGGSGALLYLIAWLVMPDEHGTAVLPLHRPAA